MKRFHKLTAWLLTLAMLMTFIPSFTLGVSANTTANVWDGTTASQAWKSGTGAENDPYVIMTSAQLAKLAADVNGGTYYADKYFKLGADLDLNGSSHNWTPIGGYHTNGQNNSAASNAFAGVFDGNNKTISNMKSDGGTTNYDYAGYRGLFGNVSGTVQNLTMQTPYAFGRQKYLGALAAYADGATFKNITIKDVSIDQGSYQCSNVGGMVGCIKNGTVENCHMIGGSVVGGSDSSYTGGIVAYADSTNISDCSVKNLSVSATWTYLGGVVGYSQYGDVINCVVTDSTITSTNSGVGGIIGYINGTDTNTRITIKNCGVSGGSVTGSSTVGGIASQTLYANVCGCYNIGAEVAQTSTSTSASGGGIVGVVGYTRIFNCFGATDVTAPASTRIGAIFGNSSSSSYGGNAHDSTVCTATKSASSQGTTGYTTDEIKAGAATYAMSSYTPSTSNAPYTYLDWGQKIGTDDYPVLNTEKDASLVVYGIENNDGTMTYYNAGGEGAFDKAEDGYYEIANVNDWYRFARIAEKDSSANARLVADIDFTGVTDLSGYVIKTYSGIFEGKSFAVKNINATVTADFSFFTTIEANGKVKNFNLDNVSVSSTATNKNVSLISKTNNGTIENISASNITVNSNYASIFAYDNKGTIKGCTVSNIDLDSKYSSGAIASKNYSGATIENCKVLSGTVTIYNDSTSSDVGGGGIVGNLNGGTIKDCTNAATVSVTGGRYTNAGGIAGSVVGSSSESAYFLRCSNTGSITLNDTSSNGPGYAGGITGGHSGSSSLSYFNVEECYNTGNIRAEGSDYTYASGIAGKSGYDSSNNYIKNCWNSGTVTNTSTNKSRAASGIAYTGNAHFYNCLNVGTIIAGARACPIIGTDYNSQAYNRMHNCYSVENCLKGIDDTTVLYGNSYYGNNEYDKEDGVTETELANGSVLEWLNSGNETAVWGQIIGTHDHPVLISNEPSIEAYKISATVTPTEGGSVTGSGSYMKNTSVTLTATANDGYAFLGWMENGALIENAAAMYTFDATTDRTLVAVFAPTHTITVDLDGGVLTQAAKDEMEKYNIFETAGALSGELPEGLEVELKLDGYETYITKDGYVLVGFTDGTTTYNEDTKITVSEDKNYTLIWKLEPHEIINTLTGVTTSNTATEREQNDTTAYIATLSVEDGYVLPDAIVVKVGGTELATTDYTYNSSTGALEISAEKITGDLEIICSAIELVKVTFNVSDTEHTYETGTKREISFTPSALTKEDYKVKYYLVNENSGVLYSTAPEDSAITAGKYLYVIDFKEAQTGYVIADGFDVTSTALPTGTHTNCGYMYIKAASSSSAQKPIYFKDGTVNLKVNDTHTNELTNDNGTTPTFTSSNSAVATVDSTGKVTAVGKGIVTITAKSEKNGTTPVYASYTVNVGLATKTLTANDFVVTAKEKTYNGTKDVIISATVKSEALYTGDNIKVDITGEFADSTAGNSKTVNYKITGISGTGAENYVLENGIIESTTTANITKATVTIICATTTTRTFDGTPQSVETSAMANGAVFDSSNYTVKYNNGEAPSGVGPYDITVELTEEAAKNYNVADFDATLIIKSASQEVFSIEGVPEAVYYGNSFTLSTDGASGTVTYSITEGTDIATLLDGDTVTVTGVGKVTITATSVKDGHTDRVATKSFNAKQRILTPTATATNRTYNGENGVEVAISLEKIVNGDTITATGTGTMLNADAGDNKIVYVSGITLDGAKKDLYTLDTTSVQTTVNIAKKKIEEITVSASDKKYDGNENATATVERIKGVIPTDAGQVEVIGSAVFADANSKENKTVTFTASSLAGAKAANYYIDGTLTAETTATISSVTVNFVVGQTSFVYDGNDKEITLSASDEFGRIFTEYDVAYDTIPNAVGTYTATVVLDDSVNYTTTQGEIPVTISEATQDNLVIVGLPGTIQYGDSFEIEAVGGEDGGTYEWNVKDGADVTLSATDTAATTVTIGYVVDDKVEIEVVKKTENYKDISAKVVFVPTAKVVTFDISNLEQTYDGEEKEIEVDTEATTYTVTYNGSNDKPVNAGTYTVKVEANGNYNGMQTATLVIKKATATGTITGINDSYTYGDTITGVDVSNRKTDTDVKITYAGTGIYVPQDTPPTKVGNYTVIAEITGDNYETLTLIESFEIKKATLTVKAKDTSRAYGEANPIFELEYDGFKNGETKDVLLAEPIATVNANAASSVDDYEIKVSGGSAENYEFKYDNTGKLTVTGATGGSLYITGSTNTAYVNDVFGLHAFYGNSKVNVTWESSDSTIAEIAENGTVTAKKAGTVTITAKADDNYGNAEATFELTVKQTGITLVPTGLVKTYTGERQDISFAANADFTPVLSGEGKNIDVTYTLISNPSVTEPIQAGTYSVVYTISDGSYTGGGNTTMYINKATVTAKVKDDSKVYGDEYSAYDLEITDYGTLAESVKTGTLDEIKTLATYASEGAVKTAIVKDGGYEITPTLSKSETDNVIFTVEKGTLTVTKAPLTVKVKDVSREYGSENPTLEVEYTGFKNEENENTENIFTGELVLAYDESITAETAVGEYADKTTASGIDSVNYEITFAMGKVTITKIGVTASAGTSKSSYLTVKFDKAIAGLTKDNFTVTDGTNPVEITEATASNDNKTYTLKGSFSTSVTYTVTPNLAGSTSETTHEITSEPLSIKPTSSGGGGGGGGGSSAPTTYTVKFETNEGSEIDSVKITRNKTAQEPTAPTKDGYTFNGWYTDKELTKPYDFETKVTKSFTLYAKWTENKVDDTDDNTDDKTDTPTWENPFTDVDADDWYYENVEYAVKNGLFNGTTETTFAPNGIITRAMMVTVLYRAENEPTVTGTTTFEDVDSGAYYAKAVVWGQQNGIIKGYSETEFAPDQNITREQIAAIMHRYAQYKDVAPTGAWAIRLDYADLAEISDYAVEGVMYCTLKEIMQGKGNNSFAPKDNATRAEIAAIIHRFIEANK